MSTHELPQQLAKSTSRQLGKTAAFALALAAAAPLAQALVLDTQTLIIGSGGVLDVQRNNVIVRTGDLAVITGYVASGFNIATGYWDGPGVNSSTAAADPLGVTAVGIANNAEIGYSDWPPLEPVSGLAGTEILLKYTYYGDTVLDGSVDVDIDYLQFLTGLNNDGNPAFQSWLYGDFNYSGDVDADEDYLLFLAGLNGQGPPLSPAGAAPVPEPSSLGLCLLGLLGIASRRLRKP